MKDYYHVLGLTKAATANEIRAAYKRLILTKHTDKAGEGLQARECAILIIEAYTTLSNEEKRLQYDEALELFNLSNEEEQNAPAAGSLTTNAAPYSAVFEREHKYLVEQFSVRPHLTNPDKKFIEFDTRKGSAFEVLCTVIREFKQSKREVSQFGKNTLSLASAINLLRDFLTMKYIRKDLITLTKILQDKMTVLKNSGQFVRELKLYEGICDIISLACGDAPINDLMLNALQKISDYAKEIAQIGDAESNLYLAQLMPLFADKMYRELYAFALNQYWQSDVDELSTDRQLRFNGCARAATLLENLNERIKIEPDNKAIKLKKLVMLLNRLEKHSSASADSGQNLAKFYRDKSFILLNWIPALTGMVNVHLLINIFLQAGICFQKAAREETRIAFKQADEKMAFKLYLEIVVLSTRLTPDVELYVFTHVTKLLSMFLDDEVEQVAKQLQERAWNIANMFPFYQPGQSHIQIFEGTGANLILMRQFLHNLISMHEANPALTQVYEHELVNVLYEAYAACGLEWYEEEHAVKTEESIRYKLMQELLRINHWSFTDVNKLFESPGLTIARDEQGWRSNSASLVTTRHHNKFYSRIDGLQINQSTGEIFLALKPWKSGESSYSKLLDDFDFEELFNRNIAYGVFSLDPPQTPTSDWRLHPFNQIRCEPSAIYQTQFFHTMFVVDYLLKKLCTKRNIQAKEPYAMHSSDSLLKGLPLHLSRIITNYTDSRQSGAIHRMWFEAEEVPIAIDKQGPNDEIITMAFGELRMVVRKHVMERKPNGELVDTKSDDEGWDMYVIKPTLNPDLRAQLAKSKSPAIIWLEDTEQFYLYENNSLSELMSISGCKHFLLRLFKIKRDENGLVLPGNFDAEHLVFTLTKKLTAALGKSHHFSAEYIFAQEFTQHYEEFARYFPELGRLRELSKAVIITRKLEEERLKTDSVIRQLIVRIANDEYWLNKKNSVKPHVIQNIKKQFDSIKEQVNYAHLPDNVRTRLRNIANQISTLSCSESATENQWNNCLEQLRKIFSDNLKYFCKETVTILLTKFLQGEPDRLINALVGAEKDELKKLVQNQFYPAINYNILDSAFDDEPEGLEEIANSIIDKQIADAKGELQQEIAKHKKLAATFATMGFKKTQTEIDLSKLCLWVPASINHASSNLIYGGVQVVGIPVHISNVTTHKATLGLVHVGQKIYRVWGGESGAFGSYWTTINPASATNYRKEAGLPIENTGRFVTEAVIIDNENAKRPRRAVPLHGNPGGLTEVYIPNAAKQVKITRISGVNPPF